MNDLSSVSADFVETVQNLTRVIRQVLDRYERVQDCAPYVLASVVDALEELEVDS